MIKKKKKNVAAQKFSVAQTVYGARDAKVIGLIPRQCNW